MGLGVVLIILGLGLGSGFILGVLVCSVIFDRVRRTLFGWVLRDFIKMPYNPSAVGKEKVINPDDTEHRLRKKNVNRRKNVIGETSKTQTYSGELNDKAVFNLVDGELENMESKLAATYIDKTKIDSNESLLATVRRVNRISTNMDQFYTISIRQLPVKCLSDISRTCSGNNFSCYRTIIPWVSLVNTQMAFILNDILPEAGPVASMELGSALAQLACDFKITELRLPTLINVTVNGKIYLHFDSMKLETVNITVCKLLSFNGLVGASLDPTSMIKAAASVGAPTIAANEASAIFREQLSNMVKVETVLTSEDQDLINRERSHVRYLQKLNITNDHPLMAAYREIIRHDSDHMFNVKNTKMRTLILGASAREIKLYNNNKNVFYQIALREGKDMNRFVTDCLMELKDTKARKLGKKKGTGSELVLRRAEDAVVGVKLMIEEWKSTKKLPDRFMLWDESIELFKGRLGIHNFDVIIFQDVGYNYSEADWINIFHSTGASTGYGYMCLPWELIEPNLLSTHGYVYKTESGMSKLAYYGYANGYVHKTENWSVLMRSPVLVDNSFSIIIEFVARIGPMTCIRMVKSNLKELHVRNLEIPEYLRTVQILDIVESFNSRKQKLNLTNLIYFPVKASEFHDVVNYALDIAKEAVNFNTILLYIRRRCSGISLVTRDIAKSWTAPKHKLPAFALVVYLYTNHLVSDFVNLQEKHHMLMPSKFKLFLKQIFIDTSVMEMFRSYYEYFLQQDLFHILVKDVDHSFWQEKWAKGSSRELKVYNNPNPEELLEFSDDETIVTDDCNMCLMLKSVSGGQIFTCDRDVEELHSHNFTLDSDELTKLKASLGDTSHDHPGIKGVKDLALSKVPPSVFQHKAYVYYISGPPGTGKSYIIRALAKRDDLIITPFARLKQDYTNFIHPITKLKTSLRCSTQHAAFAALNHPRIFVDEYTAMPYEFLAVIVNNCAAEEVFLVGDHKQLALINEVEGLSIHTKIDFSKIRAHELVRNYRNPKDAVFVLNTIYLYNMINMKDFDGFSFDSTNNYDKYDEHTPLFFRYSTAERFGIDSDTCQKVTVRSNQGATYIKVKLIVTENDKDVFNIPSMAIVALSRHTTECVILYDETAVSGIFVQMIRSGIDRPRVASLPKLSPMFDFDQIIDRDTQPQQTVQQQKSKMTKASERKIGKAPVDQPTTFASSSKVSHKDTKIELEHPSSTILTESHRYKVFEGKVLVVIKYLKLICIGIYNVLIFIRDFDRQTITSFLSLLGSYLLSKVLPYIRVERVVNNLRDQVDQNDQDDDEYHEDDGQEFTESQTQFEDDIIRRQKMYSSGQDDDQVPKEKDNTSGTDTGKQGKSDETSTQQQEGVASQDDDGSKSDTYPFARFTDLLANLPNQNVCMLQSLATLSGNNIANVWKSMLIAVGKDKAEELYNSPWSTDEMHRFCCLNNLTVTVIMDDKDNMGCVYGSGQNHIGIIDYSSKGVGHFYVKSRSKSKPTHFNLITKDDDESVAKRKTDKLYITHDTLKQISRTGDTPYNIFIYDVILNYMRDGSIEHMIGGESNMLNDIGICDAIYVKGNLPTRYDFLKIKKPEPTILDKMSKRFSQPLLIIDFSTMMVNFVITNTYDYTREIKDCRPLSKFLKAEKMAFSGFDNFIADRITPRDLKHLAPAEVKERMRLIIQSTVRRLKSNDTMTGGTTPQVQPFTNFQAVKAKEITHIPLENANEYFKEMARLFVEPIYINKVLVEDQGKIDNEFVPIENTSFDAFKMLFEDMATIDENNFELTNQEAIGYLAKEFGNGVFNLTALDNLNQKFKPLKQTEHAWSLMNVAPGVTYYKSHLTQSLFCLQMRYLTRAFITTHNIQSIDKAREIAELFFYEHMQLNFDIFNEQDLYQTILESEKAMEQKHYDKQADFELSGDTIVRFSMKDIFKPFKTSIDLYKPGQGISAWSKNMQTIFQTSFRIINKHFINCLEPNVIFDNGIDEYTLMTRVNGLFKLLPDIAINGVIDATACDSGQNKFTQMIERVILERLGINDYFLDWYYSHREEYTLKGYNVTATVQDIKTSGEPATLLNNTILMACLMNYLIRGDGPSVLVIKGDDGLKRQLNLRCNEAVLPLLRNYLKMEFKIDINVPITFCGYFLSGSNLVPDIIRKCFKIAGHRFRDYMHFAEYQQSLRDWVLTVNKMDIAYVCDVTAQSYKLNYEFVSHLFESIVSLTHINERQFRNTFKYKEFNWVEDYECSTPWKDKLPWYQGHN